MANTATRQISPLLLPFAVGFCKDTQSHPTALLALTDPVTDLVKCDATDAVSLTCVNSWVGTNGGAVFLINDLIGNFVIKLCCIDLTRNGSYFWTTT
jgi:hypothetical protein